MKLVFLNNNVLRKTEQSEIGKFLKLYGGGPFFLEECCGDNLILRIGMVRLGVAKENFVIQEEFRVGLTTWKEQEMNKIKGYGFINDYGEGPFVTVMESNVLDNEYYGIIGDNFPGVAIVNKKYFQLTDNI